MNFDLEIINEEDDCPNHLFESIMNAMNSMKEATADKIYQKIQRDGETNYSKPQVDKALANALKYGIFEVRNNRYRVRDEILEDDDTVYWKLHEKKDRTPFRIHERISEKQFGLKLDPERDNQRFRKVSTTEMRECPHCGRVRRIKGKEKKKKSSSVHKKSAKQKALKKNRKNKKMGKTNEQPTCRKAELNSRKEWRDRHDEFFSDRKKSTKEGKEERPTSDTLLNDFWIETKELQESGSFDSTYSHINFLEGDQELDNSNTGNKNVHNKQKTSQQFIERDDDEEDKEYKSDTESGSSVSIPKNFQSHADFWDSVMERKDKKNSSRTDNCTVRNQFLRSDDEYHNQYDNSQPEQRTGTSDWLGHSDEPQGTIIQSNNVLTIEPMDSLAFNSSEQASYIT